MRFLISASIGIFVLLSINCFGQESNADLPTIVPPSPELASLDKVANVSSTLHTGTASVNIPLYQVKVGAITVPIAITYSSNGTRVNDIPSRVGLGWNLMAGGTISRTVHDEDDEDPATLTAAVPSFVMSDDNKGLYDWLKLVNMENYDTERDEFSLSGPGISGKFFKGDDGVYRFINHSNVRIQRNGAVFIITDAQGIRYYFGSDDQTEKTRGYQTNGVGRWDKIRQTGWFLTKVISPDGDSVMFNYDPIFIKTLQGPSQSVILKKVNDNGTGVSCEACNSYCTGKWQFPLMNQVDYDTKYLTSIISSNGQRIYFVYQSRQDSGLDNRLVRVTCTAANGPNIKTIKDYIFEYDSYSIASDWNQRFYLKKLFQVGDGGEGDLEKTLVHQFEYNDPSSLPSQRSLNQDFFGFFNAATNANFFPKPISYTQYERGSEGADRSSNFDKTIKGALVKITYPTGGYDQISYEPHTLAVLVQDTVYSNPIALSGSGLNSRDTRTFSATFTTGSVASVKFDLYTYNNPSGPFPGQANYWTPDNVHEISKVEIVKVSTNQVVSTFMHKAYRTDNNELRILEANTQYRVDLTVYGASVFSELYLKYVSSVGQHWSNNPNFGARVRKITSYDPVSKRTTNKFYFYSSFDELSKSSGVGVTSTYFQSTYPGGGLCTPTGCQTGQGAARWVIQCSNLLQVSSSGLAYNFTFNGSPVAYRNVIECDDSLLANGAIEHNYFTAPSTTLPQALVGTIMPGAPSNVLADLNGVEATTKVFKRMNNQNLLIRETLNRYSIDSRVSYNIANYLTRQRWSAPAWTEVILGSQSRIYLLLAGYDAGLYTVSTNWYRLDTVINKEYDQDGLNPVVTYKVFEYNNPDHTLTTLEKSWDSRNQLVEVATKYPSDFTSAPYSSMTAAHIWSPVIESSTKKSGILLSTVRTDYADFAFGHRHLYKPHLTSVGKGSNTPEPRIRYYAYDASGNPLEVSKENGPHISYIWNYNGSFPVAEVKNSTVNDIAYTSFEGDDFNQWNLDVNGIRGGGFTGDNRFDGTVTRLINSSTTYDLTLWALTAGPLVNGQVGQLITTRNNWKLYKWSISGRSDLTISGTGIDEIRLCPPAALMSTYTYKPYVGISTVCDMNHSLTRYSYDALNRLSIVRDMDNNILKQYEYKYNQAIAACANTTPQWEATGLLSCVKAANGDNTGEQLRQDRDVNTCSATYLQTRWVSIGVTGQCNPIPDCNAPDKRVINGVCETAIKFLLSSVRSGRTGWTCTYKYIWSDGFESQPFTEIHSSDCMVLM